MKVTIDIDQAIVDEMVAARRGLAAALVADRQRTVRTHGGSFALAEAVARHSFATRALADAVAAEVEARRVGFVCTHGARFAVADAPLTSTTIEQDRGV